MENEIKVLIIEDEALIAQTIKMQLEDFGYDVVGVCYNYHSAIKAITETVFDVLITDINLGDGIDTKSGIQIAEQVKQIKNCPVIFLTAFSDKDTIKKAAVVSPSAYLVKPVNNASLFAAVQLAVEHFQNSQSVDISIVKKEASPDYFFTKLGNTLFKIFWKDVYCMESFKNYVQIKTPAKKNGLLIRTSLQQLLQYTIPPNYRNQFIKINRSTAIAKNIILKVNNDSIETTYGSFEGSVDFKKIEN